MVPYIHIFYTARRRRKNSGFLGVKMVLYIHILDFFGGQNAAIYTHFWNLIFSEKTKEKKAIPCRWGPGVKLRVEKWNFTGWRNNGQKPGDRSGRSPVTKYGRRPLGIWTRPTGEFSEGYFTPPKLGGTSNSLRKSRIKKQNNTFRALVNWNYLLIQL